MANFPSQELAQDKNPHGEPPAPELKGKHLSHASSEHPAPKPATNQNPLASVAQIESRMHLIREQKAMLGQHRKAEEKLTGMSEFVCVQKQFEPKNNSSLAPLALALQRTCF